MIRLNTLLYGKRTPKAVGPFSSRLSDSCYKFHLVIEEDWSMFLPQLFELLFHCVRGDHWNNKAEQEGVEVKLEVGGQ